MSKLTMKDRRALLLYLGVMLLCAACFAGGMLVARTMQPSRAAMSAKQPETGFVVRVPGLSSAEEAERLSTVLRERGHKSAAVETATSEPGHAIKIGPFTTRTAADDLTLELRNAGYGTVQVVPETPGRQ